MPNNIKTYDRSDDPKDHLKIFQAAAKVERWAMLTWCHMFNSTLIGCARVWFDDIPLDFINSYDDLKKGIPSELPSTKEAYQGSGRNPPHQAERRGIHRRREVAAFNQARKKILPVWKQQEARRKQNFNRRGDFRNQQRSERRHDKFTLLTKSPKEIFALDKGKFKTPLPMTTLIEKRNRNKLSEFQKEVGHNTDECMHLKRQIEELIKAGKLSHVIKTSRKDKAIAILMVQPWQRVARQRITQSFSLDPEILFPPLGNEDGMKGPMIIKVEIGGHFIHRIYVDGGSVLEILYKHYFSRLRPEVKSQMVPATVPLVGFSGEIIWPIEKISLLVKIGDEENFTSTWMNFMVVRSPSPYNVGRPRVRRIQAVPSTAHRMLKFPVPGGRLTLWSSRIYPLECTMVSGPEAQPFNVIRAAEERIKVTIHPEHPKQTIAICSTLTEDGRFDATNNEAEYEALIAGLRIAKQMGIKNLQANLDSRLVANQVNGSYIAKELGMIQYLEKFKTLAINFKKFSIKQVPRSENKKANALSKIAFTSFAHLTKVLVEELKEKSINEEEVLVIVEEERDTWMTPISNYLMEETLPTEKEKARVVR
ncbi:reverse transcriptase domain-containing protein [Tanacetum coccineum]